VSAEKSGSEDRPPANFWVRDLKEERMDAIVSMEAPARPPEDLAAEGMWRIAAGKSCSECWDELPEQQREWWRCCAMHAIREWFGGLRQPM
jgi:hypothetical protein